MSKVAIYHRSCPYIENDNMQELRDYAKAQDWKIIEYVESKSKGQPVLSNLLRDAKNGDLSVVIVHSLLTVGNSLKQVLMVLDKLRGLGIGFISLSDGLDMNSTAGSLIDALTGFQKALTSSKIRMGLELARMRNVVLGRKPIDPEKVQSILDAHRQEMSVRDVAKFTKVPKSTCFRVIKDYQKGQVESTMMSVQVGGML